MPVTDFSVKEKYRYLEGFGQYHQSEAFPNANPVGMNSPQIPAYGLLTERISGTSFTAPRDQNQQTWLYRTTSSLDHTEFIEVEPDEPSKPPPRMTPNSYLWRDFPTPQNADWLTQHLLALSGDPVTKTGLGYWVFSVSKDMSPHSVFSSLDGDALIILQSGTLDIQTELGHLLVRQNEIAVIPRGIRYRVTLPNGPARGYVCELWQGHFRLPELGPIGSCSLANVRDFQIPTAFYDGGLDDAKRLAVPNNAQWTIITRMAGRLFTCAQDHTPFDVAAWHGTYYPYKYDLARYTVLGSVLFDHPDPSLFTVLTAPSHREPGTAVVDFAIIPPRWNVMEGTYWLPYYHRNTMSEFSGPIVYTQDPAHPFNEGSGFKPYGAALSTTMTSHGADAKAHEQARTSDLKPEKVMTDGITIFLLETEMPLWVSDWAMKLARPNFNAAKPNL